MSNSFETSGPARHGYGAVLGVAMVLVGIVVAARLLPHPSNTAPVAACALFAGFYFRRLWLALAVPVLGMFISDQVLGTYDWRQMGMVYAALALPMLLGPLLRGRLNPLTVGGAAVGGGIGFYLVSNFGVWAFDTYGMYPPTLAGLVQSYIAGLPFLKNTLLGDLAWAGVFFGGYALATYWRPTLAVGPVRGEPAAVTAAA